MPRTRSSTVGMSSELPSDLLIFSPAVVIQALCIQYDANGWPAARDCACSFSWCGKRRSTPPPWMSKAAPRYLPAMAEHSMCHPGRPRPRARPRGGLRLAGVVAALPEREVTRVALAARVGVAGGLHVVDPLPRQLAVRRPGAHVEVDVARAVLGGVRVTPLDQRRDQLEDLRHVAGRGRLVGRAPTLIEPKASSSSRCIRCARLYQGRPCSSALPGSCRRCR